MEFMFILFGIVISAIAVTVYILNRKNIKFTIPPITPRPPQPPPVEPTKPQNKGKELPIDDERHHITRD